MKNLTIRFATSLTLAATAFAQSEAKSEGPLHMDPVTGEVVFQDAAPADDGGAKWEGSINIGATITDGNTNRRTASAGARAQRDTDQDRLTMWADWNYADEKPSGPGQPSGQPYTRNQRRTRGFAKYDYFLNDDRTTYVYGSISAEGDEFADLDLRLITSAGAGQRIINEENITLDAEAGLAYYVENRSASPDDDYLAARLAYNLAWTIRDGVELAQNVEYIPGLDEADDIYVRKDTRLKTTLTDNMFMMLQWVLDYDNTPARTATGTLDRVDNLFLISIGWNFGTAE